MRNERKVLEKLAIPNSIHSSPYILTHMTAVHILTCHLLRIHLNIGLLFPKCVLVMVLCIKRHLQYSSLPRVPNPCTYRSFAWDRSYNIYMANSTVDAAHHIFHSILVFSLSYIHTFSSTPHSRTPPYMFLPQDNPPGFTPVQKKNAKQN
jgi:hypothetical protein